MGDDFLAAFPILVSDVIGQFMQQYSRERGPLNEVRLETALHDSTSLLTDLCHIPAMNNPYNRLLKVGRAVLRTQESEIVNLQSNAKGVLQNTRLTLKH